MTEVQATIQALATVESLTNDIDTLAVLDRQVKDLTAKCKVLKDGLANQYGEGKFRGEKYGVRITIENRKGSLNADAIMTALRFTEQFQKMSDQEFEKAFDELFRGESTSVIKVASIA